MNTTLSTIDRALNNNGEKYFRVTQIILATVTVLSVFSIILESVPSFDKFHTYFYVVEWACVSIFTMEYFLRIAVSSKKVKYIFSFWGLVDFISILPTFLGAANLTFLKSFRELRIMRMLRMMRLAKISRYYLKSHDEVKSEAEFNKINIVIYFMSLFSMTIILASVLYALEHAQHAYSSIPRSMIQSAKILVGGIGQAPTTTLAGEITVIVGRFVGLALFGLLIAIIGGVLHELLFGSSTKINR